MTASDWLWYLLVRGIDWLNPIIYAIGLVVAIKAYRWGRNRGYIAIAAFFALALYAYTFAPHVNRFLARTFWPQPPPTDEQTKAFNQELDALYEKYNPQPTAATRNVSFPLGPIILVAGLWSVARRERKKSEPAPSPYSSPAAGSESGEA
jgi:hypothetical protein